ncbi:GNAT family N-acetyltransferase [Streptomonospora arabica]|uniref:GNAT family N-acetyltransferase n=1 Tax=Streptomonospora arabica TaxID=412417 RepID=A0ABV9SE95_9ACTN
MEDYRRLRTEADLSPVSREQAVAALPGSWAACHAVAANGTTVGMGRVLGDGGWYFHIVDMAVVPGHQGNGIGGAVLRHLLDVIREQAPPGAFVNLLADPPGRRLYRKLGFTETAPDSVGMAMRLP